MPGGGGGHLDAAASTLSDSDIDPLADTQAVIPCGIKNTRSIDAGAATQAADQALPHPLVRLHDSDRHGDSRLGYRTQVGPPEGGRVRIASVHLHMHLGVLRPGPPDHVASCRTPNGSDCRPIRGNGEESSACTNGGNGLRAAKRGGGCPPEAEGQGSHPECDGGAGTHADEAIPVRSVRGWLVQPRPSLPAPLPRHFLPGHPTVTAILSLIH